MAQPSVRLGVIGDVHWNAPWVEIAARHATEEGAAALLFVGDLADAHAVLRHPRYTSYEAGVLDVFKAARRAFSGPILYVPGNHDVMEPRVPDLDALDVRNVDGRVLEIAGLRIGGLGGALPAGGWPYEWTENEADRRLSLLGPVDVLLCHSPPAGLLALRFGSEAITTYIDEDQPRFALFGHVHECAGIQARGPTVCLNAGAFGPPNARLRLGVIETVPDRGWLVDLDRRAPPFDPRQRA